MPIRLTVTVKGFDAAVLRILAVDKVVRNSGKDMSIAALNAMGKVFESNFQSEGSMVGGWEQLADRTVENRMLLGFPGEHPILYRYGDLREWTATGLRRATGSGTFGATDAQGKSIEVSIKAGKNGAIVTASGVKSINQNETARGAPARPYWFTTSVVQDAARKGAVKALAANIRKMRG